MGGCAACSTAKTVKVAAMGVYWLAVLNVKLIVLELISTRISHSPHSCDGPLRSLMGPSVPWQALGLHVAFGIHVRGRSAICEWLLVVVIAWTDAVVAGGVEGW